MSGQHGILAAAAVDLAREVPEATLIVLADAIERCDPSAGVPSPTAILHQISNDGHRALAAAFLRSWSTQSPDLPQTAVALSVVTAARARQAHAREHHVELVWTGPSTKEVAFRRTEQAILQVLDTAKERITLVSYAVYRIPYVCDALVRAACRGVRIRVVVETPNRIDGQGEYNTLRALGPEVGDCSAVYFWPQQRRLVSDSGRPGILHVKCVAADGRWLFVSSANLTEYAFTTNMELGLLIKDVNVARQVEAQFDRLVALGILESV